LQTIKRIYYPFFRRIIEKYETLPPKTKKKQQQSSKQSSEHIFDLIDNNISSSSPDSDTLALTEHGSQDIMQEKEDEPQNKNESRSTSRLFSKSSRSTNSIVTNSSECQSSSSSSSPHISINSLLPRPPLPILRNSIIDNNIDPTISKTISNGQDNDNDLLVNNQASDDNDLPVNNQESDDSALLVNNEENELIDGYISQINEEIQADIRRSNRRRTKNKRIYSPEPNERATKSAAKMKKS
jgi:hypothetical protein